MFKGKAWKYGDNVDTDVIIPARYLTSTDPEVLKVHCLEDLDREFAGKVRPGDILVGGRNFGCGSSREHAPLALKSAGVSAVIAASFGRIFFRNSFNIGLPILESAEAAAGIETGDEVEVDLNTGRIKNLSRGLEFEAQLIPEFMQELIRDGGLLENVKRRIAEGRLRLKTSEEKKREEEEINAPKKRGVRMKQLEEEAKNAGLAAPWEEETSAEPAPTAGAPAEDDLEAGEEEENDE